MRERRVEKRAQTKAGQDQRCGSAPSATTPRLGLSVHGGCKATAVADAGEQIKAKQDAGGMRGPVTGVRHGQAGVSDRHEYGCDDQRGLRSTLVDEPTPQWRGKVDACISCDTYQVDLRRCEVQRFLELRRERRKGVVGTSRERNAYRADERDDLAP